MYWKDRSSAWGGKKVFLACSGQLRSRRFPSTPLLLTQQKETEFSNLFRVSFANLQKQGEIFPCSLQHLVGEAPANIGASLPTAQPGVTQSSPGGAGARLREPGETARGGGYQNPDITAAAKPTPSKNTTL